MDKAKNQVKLAGSPFDPAKAKQDLLRQRASVLGTYRVPVSRQKTRKTPRVRVPGRRLSSLSGTSSHNCG